MIEMTAPLAQRMQLALFEPGAVPPSRIDASSTFQGNLTLPVHRWFRFSAGFSAEWVSSVIQKQREHLPVCVFDPFAGSGTTLLAAENEHVESWGIDAHPFIARIAAAKLQWRSDPHAYRRQIRRVLDIANKIEADLSDYPELIERCFSPDSLADLDRLRRACIETTDETPASELVWLTLVSILRKVSRVGTAQWQYVLPRKRKKKPAAPLNAFRETHEMFYQDMLIGQSVKGPRARFTLGDSRTCQPVPENFASLVITSPPYPNNYDYADATRLEMCFLQEIDGWGDLHEKIRRHLIVSCSQHVPDKSTKLEELLMAPQLAPIVAELREVCEELSRVREDRGGKKTYHLMVASYFRDLAATWTALRRVCRPQSKLCFVIGDSAPYGVYVPVVPWLSRLAEAAGFCNIVFEKIRDRNLKWKNRKHRVPLQEGRLWLQG